METPDIHDTLGLSPGGRRRRLGRWLFAALLIVALGGLLLRMRGAPAQAVSPYKTESVQKGALTISVTATGELKPVTQVNIGTEISGIVESVDVDFNSTVTVGQTLAKVNTEKLEAQAAQARAGLRSAEAKQLQAEATLAEAEAELARLQHVRELSGGRVPSKQEMDSQEASVKRARADQASTAAQVAQSQASLTAIETDRRLDLRVQKAPSRPAVFRRPATCRGSGVSPHQPARPHSRATSHPDEGLFGPGDASRSLFALQRLKERPHENAGCDCFVGLACGQLAPRGQGDR